MNKIKNEQKVRPTSIKAKINLRNIKVFVVNKDAVANSGKQASAEQILKGLRKASREGLFSPQLNP
jgi:hypothetical protein